jgi:hypothetical protein
MNKGNKKQQQQKTLVQKKKKGLLEFDSESVRYWTFSFAA